MTKNHADRLKEIPQERLEILQHVAKGKGFARLIPEDELLVLFAISIENGSIVDAVEPFRITEDADIAHIELTVNPTWFHDAHSNLTWSEKAAAMKKIIDDLLYKVHEIGGNFRYNVWTSKRSDWN